MASGRKALTEAEKEARKKEREAKKEQEKKELKLKIDTFKECDYINQLDDERILKFIDTLEKKYSGLDEKTAFEMIFDKFISGEFAFKKETRWS